MRMPTLSCNAFLFATLAFANAHLAGETVTPFSKDAILVQSGTDLILVTQNGEQPVKLAKDVDKYAIDQDGMNIVTIHSGADGARLSIVDREGKSLQHGALIRLGVTEIFWTGRSNEYLLVCVPPTFAKGEIPFKNYYILTYTPSSSEFGVEPILGISGLAIKSSPLCLDPRHYGRFAYSAFLSREALQRLSPTIAGTRDASAGIYLVLVDNWSVIRLLKGDSLSSSAPLQISSKQFEVLTRQLGSKTSFVRFNADGGLVACDWIPIDSDLLVANKALDSAIIAVNADSEAGRRVTAATRDAKSVETATSRRGPDSEVLIVLVSERKLPKVIKRVAKSWNGSGCALDDNTFVISDANGLLEIRTDESPTSREIMRVR